MAKKGWPTEVARRYMVRRGVAVMIRWCAAAEMDWQAEIDERRCVFTVS